MSSPRIAVLLPCLDEEAAIPGVIAEFRAALPGATIYVYDNNSTDRTVAVAQAAGAVVRREPQQGKGNVVRRMFADVEADIYILADGDGTYSAEDTPRAVDMVWRDAVDMIVGRRVSDGTNTYRPGHAFGNKLFSRTVAALFGTEITDLLSGYRVMSRRFVKSFPALSRGFEIESELTIFAYELRVPVAEIDIAYRERAHGTQSKLRTYRDGFSILLAILNLVKETRPFPFFSTVAAAILIVALALGIPVVAEFIRTGLVPRFPTAILASALVVLATISFTAGIIIDAVASSRREIKRLAYLGIAGPCADEAAAQPLDDTARTDPAIAAPQSVSSTESSASR